MNPVIDEESREGKAWLDRAIALLVRAKNDRKSAFRTFMLGTAMGEGADARIVVLRDIVSDPLAVQFWTDARSRKTGHFDRGAVALFWDRTASIQLRLYGHIVAEDVTEPSVGRLFDGLPDHAIRDYATHAAPSSPNAVAEDADARGDRNFARKNFLRCTLTGVRGDLVHLGRERHERFAYVFRDGSPVIRRVVP